jgi:hypothetical protein
MQNVEDLKTDVTKLLVTDHDLTIEEAEEKITESIRTNPDWWNENAYAKNLANSLASDDDDE